MAAINLIPIVGTFALYGWVLATLYSYRQGYRRLAPAGFSWGSYSYLFVGLQAVGALLLYTVAIEVAFVAGGFALGVVENWALPNTAVSEDIGILLSAALTVAVFGALFCSYVPILIAIHERGFMGALNPGYVVSVAFRSPAQTLAASGAIALVFVVALVVGALACFVGAFFTQIVAMGAWGVILSIYATRVARPVPS